MVKRWVYCTLGIVLICIAFPGTTATNIESLQTWFPPVIDWMMAIGISLAWVAIRLHKGESLRYYKSWSVSENVAHIGIVLYRNLGVTGVSVLFLTISSLLAVNTENRRIMVDSHVNFEDDRKLNRWYAEKDSLGVLQSRLMRQKQGLWNRYLVLDNDGRLHNDSAAVATRKQAEALVGPIADVKGRLEYLDVWIPDRERELLEKGSVAKASFLHTMSLIPFLRLSSDMSLQVVTILLSLVNDLMIGVGCQIVKRMFPRVAWSWHALRKRRRTEAEMDVILGRSECRRVSVVSNVQDLSGDESASGRDGNGRKKRPSEKPERVRAILNICKEYDYWADLPADSKIRQRLRVEYGVELSRNRVCELRNGYVKPILCPDGVHILKTGVV